MSPSAPELRIGRYALLGRVGRGGMGEVHRARAFGAAGVTKELCIKRIRKSRLADPSALARFVDEARLWMRLSHANIVPVFDFGRIENDYYLAMEWVDGCDLRQLIADARARDEPLEDEVVLFVAAEIARALSYLHGLPSEGAAGVARAQAVAHCDLKPSNILLSRSSEVKLADFGVAVAAESTRAGGTRGYIPPSETRGDRVGASADLYALGRVLTELLAGDADHESAERAAVKQISQRLMSEDASLSAAEVAEELEALMARARVRSRRSPRELLAARVARAQTPLEATENAEMHTDASFLDDALGSGSAESFLSQLGELGGDEPSRTTSTRHTPAPLPTSAKRPWLPAFGAVALVALAALGVARLSSPGETPVVSPSDEAGRPLGEVPPERASTDPGPREPTLPAPTPPAVEGRAGATEPEAPPSEAVRAEVRSAPVERPRAVEARGATETESPVVELPVEPPVEPPVEATVEAGVEPAHLRINARPWAEVTVDGVARGLTPITDLSVAPGSHEVHLIHPVSGRQTTTVVEVEAGEHRDVIVDLRP